MTPVFITGETGYMGRGLSKQLVALGYPISTLIYLGCENKVPQGAKAIVFNPFNASQFQEYIPQGTVLVQRLNITRPSPRKKKLLRRIDLNNVQASTDAIETPPY